MEQYYKENDKVNSLTIKRFDHVNKEDKDNVYLCQCDCKRWIKVKEKKLRSGEIKSCGNNLCKASMIGEQYGEWTVIAIDKSQPKKMWCRCSCGVEKSVDRYTLRAGKSKSCGHEKAARIAQYRDKASEATKENNYQNAKQHIGEKWGFLTITDVIRPQNGEKYKYKCLCDCGKTTETWYNNLSLGHTVSCGCIRSVANENMDKLLTKFGIPFKREYKFQDCKDKLPLPFDFALFNLDDELIGLMELNGKQHYSTTGSSWMTPERLVVQQKHDYIKRKFAEDYSIPYLVIPYQFCNDLEKFLTSSDFWEIISKKFND